MIIRMIIKPLLILIIIEPRHDKTNVLLHTKTKTQISFAVTANLISAIVFATLIVQSLYFLNPKFQASSHLMQLYRLVENPERWFSHDAAHLSCAIA